MATFVGLHHRVYLGHLDLSGFCRQVDSGTLTRQMQPCTTFNDGRFSCVKPGLISGEAMVQFYQDWAADSIDDEISVGQLGSQYPLTVIPNPTATVAAGDPGYTARGVIGNLNPGLGLKGEMASGEFRIPFDTVAPQALVLHPSTARTSTGNGTAVALAGPDGDQTLYAALHVVAYTGFANVVVKVQSDDDSGFGSATDRVTFATVTGVTSEWSTVAGDWSTETHVRAQWTVSGTGSITFVVAVGIL